MKQEPMDTTITKQKMVQAIKDLPDDTTVEQAITELVRLAKGPANQSVDWEDLPEPAKKGIKAGLADMKAGRVHSHEEVMKDLQQWR